ncbi:Dipeptidyl aminopeptidase/acylaminoacyl peptidase [Halovenus aranensis]|uniref:Dipeptidyl aminopeptidase/acylaminoacyl peptidase n=1 Tax=Halovenus aranensis TaxID=890420 RepID=A0A1G8X0E4_9EURY|nr:S9 family peptidase [Halovenus aranensis]SDJ84092.1 Dipeptidyl aminopeptidase/acylaminoacyl peptidase [Halovenus aranensis]
MERIEAVDFHDIVQIEEPRVSPDGESVAFVRKVPEDEASYAATIYVVSTGGDDLRRFTVEEGVDSQPRWSPSGDRLAFVSTRGASDDRPQLWVLPTAGGEARQVTNVVGGVSEIEWSPDGSTIALVQSVDEDDRDTGRDIEVPEEFEPDDPDPRVIDRTVYRSMERYFDGKRSHVYTVDLGGDRPGEDDSIQRLTDGDADYASPSWGEEGTLYYTKSIGDDPDDSETYEIIEHDLETETSETVHTTTGWSQGLAATSDGRVAFLYNEEDQSTLRQVELNVLDAETGDVFRPTADLDRTLGYAAAPQWGPDEQRLFFTTPDEGAVSLWRVDYEDTDPERVLREDWSSLDAAHIGEDLVAVVRSEWDHPGDLFVSTLGGAEEHRLTRINADLLDDRAVSRPEELSYTNDGTDLQGWLLTPPDFDPDETYPLAVEVHGGPHAMWTTSGTMFHEFQTLAARGYVVFWSNPRGSAGYGEEFMTAIERDWGSVTMSDVTAGIEAATDREYVDDDQLFLTGGSFGGYMTAWMVGHTDRFEAAVSQRGVYDLTSFYGSTDGAYSLVEGDFDTTPWEEPEFLWERSPTGHAHEVETPTLVLHSDDDYRTPACTAELFYRILRKHGVDTRFVRYPGEGHELSRSGQPGHIVDRIERIVRWFDGYSEYHDTERALDRDEDAGLSGGNEEDTAESSE